MFNNMAFNINFKLREAIRVYTHGPMKIEIFRISSRRSMTYEEPLLISIQKRTHFWVHFSRGV